MPMENVQTVKHINQKTAGVNPRDCYTDPAKRVFMIRIWGIVQGVKHFEDRAGDAKTSFIGEFMAQGPNGQAYSSEKLFMFKALEEKLVSVHESGQGKPVEFAYDIEAVKDETGKIATGYSYVATSLIQSVTSDRLSAITGELSKSKPLAVHAPAATEEKPADKPVAKKK